MPKADILPDLPRRGPPGVRVDPIYKSTHLRPNIDQEPDDKRYVFLAHGNLTERTDAPIIFVPRNLRIVFFYPQDRGDTSVFTCGPDLVNLCAGAATELDRWVYDGGEAGKKYQIRGYELTFAEPDATAEHDAGIYTCLTQESIGYQRIHARESIRFEDAFQIFKDTVAPDGIFRNPTTLYVAACGGKRPFHIRRVARPGYRGKEVEFPPLLPPQVNRGMPVQPAPAPPSGGRLKRRSHTHRRHKKRRTRRHR
jgi:hypothetical protein